MQQKTKKTLAMKAIEFLAVFGRQTWMKILGSNFLVG